MNAAGGSHDVTVNVTNVDEDGEVTFEGEGQFQPQVDRGLVAELDDPDGGETDAKWQWARSADGETWADIAGATSQSRSPSTDDVGMYLRATVTYEDSFGAGKVAMAVTDNTVEAKTVANAAPSFKDLDADEDTADVIEVARSVDENSAAGTSIGKPVSATDADRDVLQYKLGGDDDDMFDINTATGQLKVKDDLDSADNRATGTTPTTHTVTVTATDPSGAESDPVATVTITVNDVNESPVFERSTDEGVQAPRTTLYVEELDTNKQLRTDKGGADADNLLPAEYGVTDEDQDDTARNYSLEGPDEESFSIVAADGTLTVATLTKHTQHLSLIHI